MNPDCPCSYFHPHTSHTAMSHMHTHIWLGMVSNTLICIYVNVYNTGALDNGNMCASL